MSEQDKVEMARLAEHAERYEGKPDAFLNTVLVGTKSTLLSPVI